MKTDFTKIKKGIKRVLNVFWRHLFLTFIVFILVFAIFGALIYYSYYLKTKNSDLGATDTILTVDKVLMDDIFSEWDTDQIKTKEAETANFPDFFRVIPKEPEILEKEIATSTATSTEEELTE
jgi:membrane-bound acyltransferase YfiQ involved in biofilm formation